MCFKKKKSPVKLVLGDEIWMHWVVDMGSNDFVGHFQDH